MRVVHLIPSLNKGGTERIVINLVRKQIENGIDAKIVSFSDINLYVNETKEIEVITFPGSSVEYRFLKSPIHNLEPFKAFLSEFNPDIIHSHSYWTDLLVYSLKFKGPKYISHFHLYYPAYLLRPSFSLTYIRALLDKYRLIYQFCKYNTSFIAVSQDIERYYRKVFPNYISSKMYYIPNANDVKKKPISHKSINNQIKLLSVGRLVVEKNYFFLIRVMKELAKTRFSYQLKIAGNGPLFNEIQQSIEINKLEAYIELLGNVDDIDSLYQWCDIYVHTATSEPFGLTILEAMAHGKPCICLDAGGNVELIENGVDGFLLESKTSEKEFASCIRNLSGDDDLYYNVSHKALKKSRIYDLNEYESKIRKVYNNNLTRTNG